MMRILINKMMKNLNRTKILKKMMKMKKNNRNKSLLKNLKDKADLKVNSMEDPKAKENLSDKVKNPNSTTTEVVNKEAIKAETNPGKTREDKVETGKVTAKEATKEEASLGKTKVDKVETGRTTTETITEEESPSTKAENLSITDVEMI